MCIGHFLDGRERHRTFSLKDIRPDADDDALMSVVRTIEPLLAYPITKVRLIVKKRRVLFDVKSGIGMDAKGDAAPETRGGMPETPERATKPRASAYGVFEKSAEPTKIAARVCLFFKTFPAAFRRPCLSFMKSG
jgi:hypothetical protein